LVFKTDGTFSEIIHNKIMKTPIHCIQSTGSNKTNIESKIATGNSDAVNIEPVPGPRCGIPIENSIGGITTPNKPNKIPYGAILTKVDAFINENGFIINNTINIPPVEKIALLCKAGTSFSTTLLVKRKTE
jgi:hypothetical protein